MRALIGPITSLSRSRLRRPATPTTKPRRRRGNPNLAPRPKRPVLCRSSVRPTKNLTQKNSDMTNRASECGGAQPRSFFNPGLVWRENSDAPGGSPERAYLGAGAAAPDGQPDEPQHCSCFVLIAALSSAFMADPVERLTPATPDDVADTLAFALRFDGRKLDAPRRRDHGRDRRQATCRAFAARRLRRHETAAGSRRGGDRSRASVGHMNNRPGSPVSAFCLPGAYRGPKGHSFGVLASLVNL